MSFTVLTGKALSNAVANFGKKVATFSEALHQVAYSALAHVEAHNCASHLNKLYATLPTNYRASLAAYAADLGKVTFDKAAEDGNVFTASAKRKADMAKALAVSPAEYAREKKESDRAASAFDEVKALERTIAKFDGKASHATMQALEGALRLARGIANANPAPMAATGEKAKADAVVVDVTPKPRRKRAAKKVRAASPAPMLLLTVLEEAA